MEQDNKPSKAEARKAAMLMLAANRLVQGLSLDELFQSGLRPPQAGFLVLLLQVGPLNMSAMSRVANVTTSVATRFVERMEGKGVVERVGDEKDRRVVRVVLTEQGKQTAQNLLQAYSRSIGSLLEGIQREDLETFLRVLEHINGRFAEHLDLGVLGEAHSRRAHPGTSDEVAS